MTHSPEKDGYFVTRWIYFRALGVIYLIAFLSIWTQVVGLIGENGILPAGDFLKEISSSYGLQKYRLVPTIFWWNSSDFILSSVALAGAATAILLILDIAPIAALSFLWFFYLSLVVVGRDFLSFQWDALLLEIGFFSIFFAPLKLKPGISNGSRPAPIALWILRLVLFKLMFLSGLVKLLSGDVNWHNLEALSFHFETQPLPNVVAWYAAKLPSIFNKFSVAVMFFIELIVPFSIFVPGAARMLGAFIFIGFQVLIFITGNYCFFNLLTITLCLLLFNDRHFEKIGLRCPKTAGTIGRKLLFTRSLPIFHGMLLFVWVFLSTATYYRLGSYWGPVHAVMQVVAPFRSVNSYGLFAVMTTRRDEIVIEGSNDGVSWETYEFKWKPGDTKKAPAWVAPHQPRLDWQMWFAALSRCERTPWFVNFLVRILEGSKSVTALLASNPFPEAAPKFIRTKLYRYTFSDTVTKYSSGDWWVREELGNYCPVISLKKL